MHSCGSYFVHVPKIRLAEQLQALSHPAKEYLETKDEKEIHCQRASLASCFMLARTVFDLHTSLSIRVHC